MQEKYRVSIDRITIVGETSRRLQLSEVNELLGNGVELKNKKFIYNRQNVNSDGELIRENGFIVEETHGKWRVDFNPNKAGNIEKDKIKRFVSRLSKVHLSRIDIAFDVFNNPLAMKYRLYRKNVSELQIETYKGKAQNIETIYWGSRKSLEQVRLYNKLIEQKKNDVIVNPEIRDWTRLELQLRGKTIKEWVARAYKMLDELLLPNYSKLNLRDKADLYAIVGGLIEWGELDKRRCRQLRKLAFEGFDRDLSEELKIVLSDHIKDLEIELDGDLKEYKIS